MRSLFINSSSKINLIILWYFNYTCKHWSLCLHKKKHIAKKCFMSKFLFKCSITKMWILDLMMTEYLNFCAKNRETVRRCKIWHIKRDGSKKRYMIFQNSVKEQERTEKAFIFWRGIQCVFYQYMGYSQEREREEESAFIK